MGINKQKDNEKMERTRKTVNEENEKEKVADPVSDGPTQTKDVEEKKETEENEIFGIESSIRSQLLSIDSALLEMEEVKKMQRNISSVVVKNMLIIREAVERVWNDCDRLKILGRKLPGTPVPPPRKRQRESPEVSPEQVTTFQKVEDPAQG